MTFHLSWGVILQESQLAWTTANTSRLFGYPITTSQKPVFKEFTSSKKWGHSGGTGNGPWKEKIVPADDNRESFGGKGTSEMV